ncbi:NAD-binding protein, partial [Acinetobacter baumannii]|uniref:NAD-binding protein n=1 Tax=Acinetobacter baumannii TaxID=470 RepID=UPI001D082368
GVIGCEYASIFIGLDHKVDLINTQQKLLSYLDDEIADALSYHFVNVEQRGHQMFQDDPFVHCDESTRP